LVKLGFFLTSTFFGSLFGVLYRVSTSIAGGLNEASSKEATIFTGFPLCDVPSIAGLGDQELWLSERKLRSTATARFEKRRAARKGHVTRGDFFWFVFFFAKENEQKRLIFPNIFLRF